jgi:hypothetical protein
MAQATLMNHRGAVEVDRQGLALIEAPPGSATWFPVKHAEVLERVCETLDGAGFKIGAMQLSVARNEQRFFGVLNLTANVTNECSLAVGIRNSTDQSYPIGFAVGERVFVCDNLAFHSEIIISRRHTRHGELRFNSAVSQAVLGLHEYQRTAADRIGRLQQWELSAIEADAMILRAFEKGLVSTRTLPAVIKEWREPSFAEHRARTGYSLLQAFTFALKDRAKSSPQEFAATTIGLQRLLNPPGDVIDVVSTPAIAG